MDEVKAMTPNTRSLEERLRKEAEIVPHESYTWLNPLLLEAADALAAKDKLLVEARGVLEPWYKARLALCAAHVNTPECAAAFTALGKAENDLSTFARTTLVNLKAEIERKK